MTFLRRLFGTLNRKPTRVTAHEWERYAVEAYDSGEYRAAHQAYVFAGQRYEENSADSLRLSGDEGRHNTTSLAFLRKAEESYRRAAGSLDRLADELGNRTAANTN